MFEVKTTGTLSSEGQYKKKVHIAYDRIAFDSTCDVNVLVQIEPPSIIDITDSIRANASKYDFILTWNEDLLDLPNAQKFIFGSCWIDQETFKANKGNLKVWNGLQVFQVDGKR